MREIYRLKSEQAIFWYLLCVHLISVLVIIILCSINLWLLLGVPILIWFQRQEWRQYYFLNHPKSVTLFEVDENMVFELYHGDKFLGQWRLSHYFHIGSLLICYLNIYHAIRPVDSLLQRSFFARALYHFKTIWLNLFFNVRYRSQVIVLNEKEGNRSSFRALMRLIMWQTK